MKIFIVDLCNPRQIRKEVEVEDDKIVQYMYDHIDDLDIKRECFSIYGLVIMKYYIFVCNQHTGAIISKLPFETFNNIVQSLINRMPIPLDMMAKVYDKCNYVANHISYNSGDLKLQHDADICLYPHTEHRGRIDIPEKGEASVVYSKTSKILRKFNPKTDLLKIFDEFDQILLEHKDKLEKNRKNRIDKRLANPKDMLGAVEVAIYEKYKVNIEYVSDLGIRYISVYNRTFGYKFFPFFYISVNGTTLKIRFSGIRGHEDFILGDLSEPDNKAIENLFKIIDTAKELGELVSEYKEK